MSSLQTATLADYDVSLVLNLHNETHYLQRTMMALEEAVRFGQSHGLTFELIIVLDRPAASTAAWVAARDLSAFDHAVIIRVDHGSLGMSRNSGIDLARGEYIGTVDADDLMSFNMFYEMHLHARSFGNKAIIIQQFVWAFGYENFLVEYLGTDHISRLAFFSYHPGVSRIFAHRSLFERVRYADARLGDGYAYEDWHFSCEAIAQGYSIEVAVNTVLFYRQRPGSLLRSADQISIREIPPTTFFEPRSYLALCTRDYGRYRRGEIAIKEPESIRDGFDKNATCRELMRAAGEIDPAITALRVDDVPAYTNLSRSLAAGAAYFRLCGLLAGETFTDVVLVPFITTGGGDKYIIDVINGLSELHPERRFLVLAGQAFERHAWTHLFPSSSLFVDLYKVCLGCTEADIQAVTLRILEKIAIGATVHLKSSEYAVRFFERFNAILRNNEFIFYRFADPLYEYHGVNLCAGYMFNFLSEFGQGLSKVITDNSEITSHDRDRLDTLADRWHTLPARCEAIGDASGVASLAPTGRLLWASRLDPEKRPQLLIKIARALEVAVLGVTIDVYGSAVLDRFDVEQFAGLGNLRYLGPFSAFRDIPHAQYDAFLYTTAFDGLPNVVLEALSAGLPVIAPDVGGLRAVVRTGETGWLLDNDPDEKALAQAYVRSVAEVRSLSAPSLSVMRANAVELIRSRHSPERYLENLRVIFGAPSGKAAPPASAQADLPTRQVGLGGL